MMRNKIGFRAPERASAHTPDFELRGPTRQETVLSDRKFRVAGGTVRITTVVVEIREGEEPHVSRRQRERILEDALLRGQVLCAYNTALEDRRVGLTLREALEISDEDPSLIYLIEGRIP